MTTHRLLYGLADLPETRFDDAPPEPRRDRLASALPGGLRRDLEAAAAAEGVSADDWLIGVLSRVLHTRPTAA
jgi:hypothetical protein